MPATGNVWTWPDPVRGDNGFTSPAFSVWNETWGTEDQWYDNWNQNQKYQGNESSWRDYDIGGQFKNNLYSFTKQSYDPYRTVKGYEPKSGLTYARIMGDIQTYLDREFPELSDFSGDSGAFGQGANSTANLGGDWSGVDKWNAEILKAQQQVQSETGIFVPGNVIKAIMRIESNGNPLDGPAYGLMQVTTETMGSYDVLKARTDPAYGLWAGVNELALRYKDAMAQNSSYGWPNVAVGYFSGHYVPTGAADVMRTDDALYMKRFSEYLSQLDAAVRGGSAVGGGNVGSASSVLSIAQKYVGVPYVWGGIPGKGANPWDTGWDCSGFTYWLDQNYGGGALPMGSHYQYQYAQNTGQLFMNTAGLQAGDLVFFDTGNTAGGGAELNRAGHVGIFMGMGADGQMKMIHAANPGRGTIISNFSEYSSMFIGGMHAAWSGGGSIYGGGGVSQMDAITGGTPFPIGQEFGPTTWSEGDGAWMYGYARDYGVSGHPGIDVSAPLNTPLYSPVSGTVKIAGGTPYFTDERYGDTPGTGQLLIELDNGEQVILGHMSYISVKVGDRVSQLTPVGNSGTYNGAHYHLEWRVPGAATRSGYQVIDPRMRLGGTVQGLFGKGTSSPYRASADNWSEFMRATAEGKPVTGYTGGSASGSFHSWMKRGMEQGWNSSTVGAPPGGASSTIAGAWGIAPVQTYDKILQRAMNPTGAENAV